MKRIMKRMKEERGRSRIGCLPLIRGEMERLHLMPSMVTDYN
jgi:hypothetical protein